MSKKTLIRSLVLVSFVLLCALTFLHKAAQVKASETIQTASTLIAQSSHAGSTDNLNARRRFEHTSVELLPAAFVSPAHASPAPQSQEDKPVEQTRKNIQVLKGLPSSQLFSLMNFVASSLGVHCDYCHVKNGKEPETGFDKWVWESDDKEEKRTARRMMQMVFNVNQNNKADFRDNPVTCYTCHRGKIKPAGMPSLPLAVSGHEGGAGTPDAKATAEGLPSVEQIVNKYVEAVGDKTHVANLKTLVMKGQREASQDRIWPLEITIKEPGKYLAAITIPNQGEIRQSYSGDAGWIKNPNGVHATSPADLAALKHSSEIYDIVKVRAPFTNMRVTGRDKIGDREAYVIESKPAEGITEKLYFDTQTGLLLRKLVLTSTVLLPIPEQTDFEDYRDVEGVKLPFTIRISNIDTYYSSTRKFTEIKPNVAVEDTIFKMPAAPAATPQK